MDVTWDEHRRLWCGHAVLDDAMPVEVAIASGEAERDLTRSYAEFTFARLAPRVGDARRYAARRLVAYYNEYHAHLPDGKQVTKEEFAGRLRLEGLRFRAAGAARLDFGHDLYRGDRLFADGLVVVEAMADGRFRRAYWVTEPDAREIRQHRH